MDAAALALTSRFIERAGTDLGRDALRSLLKNPLPSAKMG